jgi:hypothetical protein
MAKINDFNMVNFAASLKDGWRPNQYKVELVVPAALRGSIQNAIEGEDKFSFMCKAAQIPGSTIGVVEVPFRGRMFKIAGDRTFEPWTTTILADTSDAVRDLLEQWSDHINGVVNSDSTLGNNPLDYMSSADVHKLSRNGEILDSYKLIGIWPQEIAAIDAGYDNTDTIGEYSVTFQVQWVENKNTRNNTEAEDFSRTGGSSVINF